MSIRSTYPASPHMDEASDPDYDPRWQLVTRIVTSQSFAKSERLSSFLTCVCDLARRGEFEQINEQYIGTTVFGRRPDYDPGADSIVRSHASRLRQRLSQYFAEEGAQEDWMLTIPKGSYLPVFQMRHAIAEAVMDEDDAASGDRKSPASSAAASFAGASASTSRDEAATAVSATSDYERGQKRIMWGLSGALVIVTLIALGFAAALIVQRRTPEAMTGPVRESDRFFWSQLFSAKDVTTVVTADSGLVILQGLTKKRVTLPMYLNGTYLQTVPPSSSAEETVNLSTRRYTSVVDLSIMSKILRLTGVDLHKTKFVYSRDLRPNEIKEGNVILLGTYESTPWVQLFEPSMNFYFSNDLAAGVFSVVNRQPKPGEQATYDSRTDDPDKTVYGVVAYRPSLNGTGKVLILEGQSMAGTETASDFVFDDGYLLPFLRSIRRADGTIPYFEVLLRSKSIGGESSRLQIAATRIEEQ